MNFNKIILFVFPLLFFVTDVFSQKTTIEYLNCERLQGSDCSVCTGVADFELFTGFKVKTQYGTTYISDPSTISVNGQSVILREKTVNRKMAIIELSKTKYNTMFDLVEYFKQYNCSQNDLDPDPENEIELPTTCAEGQVPAWDATNGVWICADATSLPVCGNANDILVFDGTDFICSDIISQLEQDISDNASDISNNETNIANNTTNIATNTININNHISNDLDTDATNEFQDLSGQLIDSKIVVSINNGNDATIDLSSLFSEKTDSMSLLSDGSAFVHYAVNGDTDTIPVDLGHKDGNVLWVSTDGNDAIAEKGNMHKPWSNVQSAISSSVAGDVINVLPGTYTMTGGPIVKNNVIVNAFEGVTITGSLTNAFTIEDNGIYRFLGDADFVNTTGNSMLNNSTGFTAILEIEFNKSVNSLYMKGGDPTVTKGLKELILRGNTVEQINSNPWLGKIEPISEKFIIELEHFQHTSSGNLSVSGIGEWRPSTGTYVDINIGKMQFDGADILNEGIFRFWSRAGMSYDSLDFNLTLNSIEWNCPPATVGTGASGFPACVLNLKQQITTNSYGDFTNSMFHVDIGNLKGNIGAVSFISNNTQVFDNNQISVEVDNYDLDQTSLVFIRNIGNYTNSSFSIDANGTVQNTYVINNFGNDTGDLSMNFTGKHHTENNNPFASLESDKIYLKDVSVIVSASTDLVVESKSATPIEVISQSVFTNSLTQDPNVTFIGNPVVRDIRFN